MTGTTVRDAFSKIRASNESSNLAQYHRNTKKYNDTVSLFSANHPRLEKMSALVNSTSSSKAELVSKENIDVWLRNRIVSA